MEDYKKYLPVPIEQVLPMEIWFPVPDYEGKYEFSCLGMVRSLNYLKTGKTQVLKQGKTTKGYLQVNVSKNGKTKILPIHRLICKFFYGLPDGYHADHRNFVRYDNRFINIRPLQARENSARLSEKGREARAESGRNIGSKYGADNGKKSRSKPVLQFDIDGNLIAEYPSASEASRQTGICHQGIGQCCKGNPRNSHAGGYIWKYKEVAK